MDKKEIIGMDGIENRNKGMISRRDFLRLGIAAGVAFVGEEILNPQGVEASGRYLENVYKNTNVIISNPDKFNTQGSRKKIAPELARVLGGAFARSLVDVSNASYGINNRKGREPLGDRTILVVIGPSFMEFDLNGRRKITTPKTITKGFATTSIPVNVFCEVNGWGKGQNLVVRTLPASPENIVVRFDLSRQVSSAELHSFREQVTTQIKKVFEDKQ